MCKATLYFVEHQQSTSLVSLLQRRPARHLQHVVDTRGVPKPVEDETRLTTSVLKQDPDFSGTIYNMCQFSGVRPFFNITTLILGVSLFFNITKQQLNDDK